MDVAFLTLFLGLAAGPQPVELTAPRGTAAIELLLDGVQVGRLAAPPWRGQVDLGTALLPHRLVARALDARGAEIGRAEQRLNLPQPSAEVQIVVESGAADQPRRIRVLAQSVTGDSPESIALTLDGRPLAPDAQGRIQLPARQPGGATRVLSAELRWPGGLTARRDLALGRQYDDEVSSELTAIPVWLRGGSELPLPAQLGGWLTADGRALPVDGVESGGEQVMVVRDPAAVAPLWHLAAARSPVETRFALESGAQVQFVWPDPHAPAGRVDGGARGAGAAGGGAELFDVSQQHDGAEHGIVWLLARVLHQPRGEAPPRLADAAAMAALQAYAGGHRRAVLVVLAPAGGADRSQYSAAAVRRYCAALHVPLFVWSPGPPAAASRAAWGEVADVSGSGLNAAFRTLRRALDAQRILLVEGQPLPQAVALAGGAAKTVSLDSSAP